MIESEYTRLFAKLEDDDRAQRAQYKHSHNNRICPICFGGDYLLEGQSFHCSGDCHEVIEVNKHYYIDSVSQKVFCEPCYRKLEPVFQVDGTVIKKASLSRRMNSQTIKEAWVTCLLCKQTYHQMCVIFNTKLNDQYAHLCFHCPYCIMKNNSNTTTSLLRVTAPRVEGTSASVFSLDLSDCDLSRFIENRIYKLITTMRQQQAQKQNCSFQRIKYPTSLSVKVVENMVCTSNPK